MAILKNVEVHWARLDPKHPIVPFFPNNDDGTPKPKQWEIQIHTTSKDQKNEFAAMGVKMSPVREDKNDEESKILYWKTSLIRKAVKREKGKPDVDNEAPSVVNGKNEPLDPTTIGNGSVCNVRVYQREIEVKGIKKTANTLMAIQVLKHIVYVGEPMEDFDDAGETETIMPVDDDNESNTGTTLPDSAF
jgi:hypothetical protein